MRALRLYKLLLQLTAKLSAIAAVWLRRLQLQIDRISIKLRFTVIFLLGLLAVLFFVKAGIYASINSYVLNNTFSYLERDVKTVVNNLIVVNGRVLGSSLYENNASRDLFAKHWQVKLPTGQIIKSLSLSGAGNVLSMSPNLRSRSYHGFMRAPSGEILISVQSQVRHPAVNFPLQVVVASEQSTNTSLELAIRLMVYAALIFMFFCMFIVLLVGVHYGLYPLYRLRVAFSKVSDGRAEYISGTFANELAPLIDSFNIVVRRYGSLIKRARAYGGNIAHGLKNPLSVIQLELNQLEGKVPRQSRELIEDQIAHMKRLIQLELSRARAAGAQAVPGQHCDTVRNLHDLLRVMKSLHRQRGLKVELDLPQQIFVDLEPQDFREILGNVIDNAFKYATSRVKISVKYQQQQVVVIIEDDGPGIAKSEHKKLFKPGGRVDTQQSGSGLGLSISRDLLQMYGGKIRLGKANLPDAKQQRQNDQSTTPGLRVEISMSAKKPYRSIKPGNKRGKVAKPSKR